jgi:hypothetical protein
LGPPATVEPAEPVDTGVDGGTLPPPVGGGDVVGSGVVGSGVVAVTDGVGGGLEGATERVGDTDGDLVGDGVGLLDLLGVGRTGLLVVGRVVGATLDGPVVGSGDVPAVGLTPGVGIVVVGGPPEPLSLITSVTTMISASRPSSASSGVDSCRRPGSSTYACCPAPRPGGVPSPPGVRFGP